MSATDKLALAALVVSAAALAVAILSAVYAHATNQRDRQRRLEEIAPCFAAELEEVSEQHTRLWLHLSGGEVDLDAVEVEVINDANDREPLEFTPDQAGVEAGQRPPRRRASWAQLRRGERAAWRVQLPEDPTQRAPVLRLRVSSRAPQGSWVTVVTTDVPHNTGLNIW